MRLERTFFDDAVKVITPQAHYDRRGFFMESYRRDFCQDIGIPDFVQENQSLSTAGVLRGLHFQYDPPMGKMMTSIWGVAVLMIVDIRYDSSTLGKWITTRAYKEKYVYIPPGFAVGFAVSAAIPIVEMQYKCTAHYNSGGESGIRWDSIEGLRAHVEDRVGASWRNGQPITSDKDRDAQTLDEWLKQPEAKLFTMEGGK